MKPDIVIKPLPKRVIKKAIGKSNYYNMKITYEEEIDGNIWVWLYKYEQGEAVFELVSIINPDGTKYDTFDGEKWGKRVIQRENSYSLFKPYNDLCTAKYGKTYKKVQADINSVKYEKADRRKNASRQEIIDYMISQQKKIPKKLEKFMHNNLEHFILFESGEKIGYCTRCKKYHEFIHLRNREIYTCPSCHKKIEARTYKTAPASSTRCYVWTHKIKDGAMVRILEYSRPNHQTIDEIKDHCKEYVCGMASKAYGVRWIEKRYLYSWKPDASWYLNRTSRWTKSWMDPNYHYRRTNKESSRCMILGNLDEWVSYIDGPIKYIPEFAHYIEESYKARYIWDTNYQLTPYDAIDFLDVTPMIESLYKLGFWRLAAGYFYLDKKEKQGELHKKLEISKEMFRKLNSLPPSEKHDIPKSRLELLSEYERRGHPVEYAEYVLRKDYPLLKVFDYAKDNHHSYAKVIKYLNAKDIHLYKDYLEMSAEENMDLSDDFVFFPRDVKASHDALVDLRNERAIQGKIKEQKGKESRFLKTTKKYRKRFTYQTDDFIIRPAFSIEEIIREGQAQHNCVGTNGYADRMMDNHIMILFLRHKDDPNKSYYTVETDMHGHCKQAFAKANTKIPEHKTTIVPILEALERQVKTYEKHHAG